MKIKCINVKHPDYIKLLEDTVLHPEVLAVKVTKWQLDNNTDDFPTLDQLAKPVGDNKILYEFKITTAIINKLDKVNQWYKSLGNTDKFWNKVQQDLQIPKEQIVLLKESEGNTIEEKLINLLANYSYNIEINTAKAEPFVDRSEINTYIYNNVEYIDGGFGYFKNGNIEITEQEYNEAVKNGKRKFEPKPLQNSSYYSNLTVPGGTNYTENEIAIPGQLVTEKPKGIETKQGVDSVFEQTPELANAVYEALGFEIPTTKLQGKQFEYGEPRFFDVVEELTSGERASLPSSILINKLLKGEYLPEIKESQIILGLSEAGIWRPNIKKIEASGENKSTLAKKIGHELLHSVTNNIILSYQNLKGTVDFTDKYYKDFIKQGYIKPVDLSKSQIEALDNLVRIRNKVVSYVEQNKDKIQKQDRGFGTYDYFIRTNYTESETDIHEFISEVFTNPELINILKEIPTEGKKSNLFKDFVDAIAKILGFTNTSILEDIIAYSEEAFFQQPQITQQQKQQALQLYSQSLESLNKPNTNPILQGNQTNVEEIITQLEKDGLLEIDCKGKLKAEKGLQTNFTKGGKWKLIKDLKGYPTHKEGGVDLTIGKNGVTIKNGNTQFTAKYGLVIPKN